MTPWHDPALLDRLDRLRAPWDDLTREVVEAAVRRFVPAGPLAEVGAGGGQLRAWLPADRAADTTHTDTSAPFLDVLRSRFPDAKTALAPATALPFADGSLAGVLGLCVLDTLPDLSAARDEFRRVLRPGGVVLHVLDLATSPGRAFAELIAAGDVPLPNFAADPGVLEVLSPEQKAQLPAADLFDEVLAVPWAAFARLVRMLKAAGQPLAGFVTPYADPDDPLTLDPDVLAQRFMHYRNNPDRLRELYRGLVGLTLTARSLGRDWPLRPLSLRDHFRLKLRQAFGPADGFEVLFAEPVRNWRIVPLGESAFRHAGKTVPYADHRDVWTRIEEFRGEPCVGGDRGYGERSTTVEVFAARKR